MKTLKTIMVGIATLVWMASAGASEMTPAIAEGDQVPPIGRDGLRALLWQINHQSGYRSQCLQNASNRFNGDVRLCNSTRHTSAAIAACHTTARNNYDDQVRTCWHYYPH